MPSPVTQAALRARVRTVVRQPNSNGFISDLEINRLLNEAAYELYDLLISARGELYYTTEHAFNTVAGQRRYALPSAFYRLVGVTISQNAGGGVRGSGVNPPYPAEWRELSRMHTSEWALQDSIPGEVYNIKYNLTGTGNAGTNSQKAEIALYPLPAGVYCIQIQYIPVLDLSPDGITSEPVYDGINGWEDYIVYSVASVIANMQEESNDLWLAKKAEIKQRIQRLAPTRDRVSPLAVADRWSEDSVFPHLRRRRMY